MHHKKHAGPREKKRKLPMTHKPPMSKEELRRINEYYRSRRTNMNYTAIPEGLFTRADPHTLEGFDIEIGQKCAMLDDTAKQIAELREAKKAASQELFYGHPIDYEIENDGGHLKGYMLGVTVAGFRIEAKAHPDIQTKGKEYTARLEFSRQDYDVPKPNWVDTKAEYGFETYEAAKETALFMLRDVLSEAGNRP